MNHSPLRVVLYTLAAMSSIAIIGCESKSTDESKSSTSVVPYKSDTSKGTTPARGTLSDQPLEQAPDIPKFTAGETDRSLSSKSYASLKLGTESDPDKLIEFLGKSNQATRELMADVMKRQVPATTSLDLGMSLARDKMEAANRLAMIATESKDEKQRVAAAVGKLEALSLMAQFRDVAAVDELRIVAKNGKTDSNSVIAQQSKSISLGLLLTDFENGGTDAADVLRECNEMLDDSSSIMTMNLQTLSQAVSALDAHSKQTEANELANKIEETMRDSDKPDLSVGAWKLVTSRLPEMQALQQMVANNPAAIDPFELKAAINAVLTKFPSPWTAFFLANAAVNVEYSDNAPASKVLLDVAKSLSDKIKNETARSELTKMIDQSERRVGIINKPLNLSGLVNMDGKPLDAARYKGKVVLVDFWATWCGPCIAEIPNIKEVYREKHKEGFEVVGVNMDDKRSDVESFLSSQELPWVTYVTDNPEQKGFDTPLAKEIGITAIPFIVLIGRDGNVASIHVRGRKLEGRVAELLAQPAP